MLGLNFIRVQPTTYLLQDRGGKSAHEGLGLSFFYYTPTTSLVAGPVASTDTPFIFEETTADFQSVIIHVKSEFAWDANYLFPTVWEPFPTKTTGATLVFGCVTAEQPLVLESRMFESGVIFNDGVEKDFLEVNSGTQAQIGIAERRGVLVE